MFLPFSNRLLWVFLVAFSRASLAQDDAGGSFQPAEGLVDYSTVGSRIAQTTSQTPASVLVISGDQLRRMGYRSVGEALASVPGIFVSDDLQNVHLAVRGVFGGARAGSRSLRVLIDGVPMTVQQSGIHLVGPELLPLTAVERIEVLKGPASALYGTGALVGAINIVSRRPPYEGQTTTRIEGVGYGGLGGQRGAGGELLASVTAERQSFLLAVRGERLDRSGLGAAPGPFAARHASLGASARDFAAPLSGLLRADAMLGGGRLSLLAVGQQASRSAEFHDLSVLSHNSRTELFNLTSSFQFERPFASGLTLLARLGGNIGGVGPDDQLDQGTASTYFLRRESSSRSVNASLEARYEALESSSAVVGVEWTRSLEQLPTWIEVNKSTGETTRRATPPLYGISNLAAYMTANHALLTWLTLAGGLRYDFNSTVGHMLGARLGLVITPSDRLSFKVLGGRSHRAPSPEQLYGVPATFLDICGPAGVAAATCGSGVELTPQYLTGAEVVSDVFVTRWLSASMSAYYNRLQNNVAYLSRGVQLVPTSYDATQYGGEMLVRLTLALNDDLHLDGSIGAALQATRTDEAVVFGFLKKDVPDNEAVPGLMGGGFVGLRYQPWEATATVEYRYVGERTPSQSNLRAAGTADMDRPSYMLDPYHLVNLTLSGAPVRLSGAGQLHVALRIANLLDARWAEIGFNGVDVPSVGRTFWLNAGVSL